MIVLKSTLESVKALYESHISDLQSQIADLKRLVFISEPTHAETLPVRTLNAVLDGDEVQPNKDETLEYAQREAARIFSGEYEMPDEETLQ
jgi:hypothetical protein